jgi:diaminopimelate decarboxylase
MNHFRYKNGELFCEDLKVTDIASQVGTPFYLYSKKTLTENYLDFDAAFNQVKHLICYSLKANSNLRFLKILIDLGSGVDVVSGGELYKALQAGVEPKKIVFAGVGKTGDEIRYGLSKDILMFNVESVAELDKIDEIAKSMKKVAPIALRVNPAVDPQTRPYYATGFEGAKFGIPISQAFDAYVKARSLDNIEIMGIHVHIGSQITSEQPFIESVSKVIKLSQKLKMNGINLSYIDIGGGYGISYNGEQVPSPKQFANAIIPILKKYESTVIIEPGRIIAGSAGILVTKILYVKEAGNKNFVVCDAGMNDFIRPPLYRVFHQIQPVVMKKGEKIVVDVVGPICESADFLGKGRKFINPEPRDLLAMMTVGAYGFTMSSNYNSRLRVPEIIVDKDKFFVARKRETYEDLLRGETNWG